MTPQTLHAYLPQDRLHALEKGRPLSDRTSGTALFADISGFTALTETLCSSLGSRRGAEALTKHLDAVYNALIIVVECYGGSVLGFAGDAMTCWFDTTQSLATERAVTCAFALQHAMTAFKSLLLPNGTTTTLALKVSVATGPARRFVVGDPTIHYIDVLAGATVARSSSGEHLAQRGEVVLDEATVRELENSLQIQDWRTDPDSGESFAIVRSYSDPVVTTIPPVIPDLSLDVLREWLHQAQFERDHSFMTEFRPCAVLFVRFTGLDYDTEDAQDQLDMWIRQLQRLAARYDGTLLQLTIGDKGSYAYINFGVFHAHEDDVRRALKLALDLNIVSQQLGFLAPLQIGITRGMMRVGAYGGRTRRTYGALGDDVNLAARLMQTASPGEILVSSHIQKATSSAFVFEPRPPLLLKGKAEPLPVFAATNIRHQRAIRLQEPTYALPMVGRRAELETISNKLDLASNGTAQVIGIVAEAGMGKSRLVAEAIRIARKKGFAGYGGACQSDAISTPYQAWKAIWQALFDVDPAAPLRKQIRLLEGELEDRVPARLEALPLLGTILDLDIPDNDFTRTLEPQHRQSALRALLEECLRTAAKDEPLLVVIEDVHWIDALSETLLDELARALTDCSICFVLAYRPPQVTRRTALAIENLSHFTDIILKDLTATEAEQAIRAKLAQLYPARGGSVPPALVETLRVRAQGNPLYLEELLNFLHDRGLDPREPDDLAKIDLPDSLHTLILSRIDQLSEREKSTLRVASIIGRLFHAAWLTGYYPELGTLPNVKSDLEQLAKLDITPLDSPEPVLSYLFKHIITHEVTYESLPFAMRARLHEQLADYLEDQIAAGILTETPLLDTLVHHYGHSENRDKQRVYLHKAAAAAQAISALTTVLDYLKRLVDLTPVDDPRRSALARQVAQTHFRLGDYSAARLAIQQAQAIAETDSDRAAALAFLGNMTSENGDFISAEGILSDAVPLARISGDVETLCDTLMAAGLNNWRIGRMDEARVAIEESLTLAQALEDVERELYALISLGQVMGVQGHFDQAEQLFLQVHTRATAIGNRERAMGAFNNRGWLSILRGDYVTARQFHQQALTMGYEIGAQASIAKYLLNLVADDIALGQLDAVYPKLREGLMLALRLGAIPRVIQAVAAFARLAHAEGQTERALALIALGRRHLAWSRDFEQITEAILTQWKLDPVVIEAGLAQGDALDWDTTIQELLALSASWG